MKIKEIFKVGNVMQSLNGMTVYLDRNNCQIENKKKSENAIILYLKRKSDKQEGHVYLRVQNDFESIADQLLNWAFVSDSLIGLTLDKLEVLETNLNIENYQGKFNIK